MHLNGFDIVIITILTLSTLLGLARGFILEIVCLIPWLLAILLAVLFATTIGEKFLFYVGSPGLQYFLAWIVIFIAVFMLSSLAAHYTKSSLKDGSVSRSGTNKVLGMIYGFIRGLLIVLLIIMFAMQSGLSKAPWYKKSALAGLGGLTPIITPIIINNNNNVINNITNITNCIVPFV